MKTGHLSGKLANLALLQGLVANEGVGWKWTLEELDRYYEACAPLPFPENLSARPRDHWSFLGIPVVTENSVRAENAEVPSIHEILVRSR